MLNTFKKSNTVEGGGGQDNLVVSVIMDVKLINDTKH